MKILDSFIASPFAAAIGWTLLHSLWEGAAIAAILAAIVVAVRSPRVRYAAACTAMAAVVAAFAATLFRLWPDAQQTFPRFRAAVPFAPPPTLALDANAGRWWMPLLAALAPWLAPFWIAGVALLSVQRVMSCFAVRRLRSRGVCFASEEWHAKIAALAAQLHITRSVHLLESCMAEIPMVLGHLRPVILAPIGLLANLPAEQAETILLHELAHIRRCDYLVNAFQRVVESILFYHPGVWWISKVIRSERENCCDDVVVSVTRHGRDYALALAALERNRAPRQQAAIAATGGTLVKRIRRLLYPKAPAGIWAPIAAVLILTATAAVSLAAWQPKSKQLVVAGVQIQAQTKTPEPLDSEAPGDVAAAPEGRLTANSREDGPASARQSPSPVSNEAHLEPLSRAPISFRATEDSRMIYQTLGSLAGVNVEFDSSFVSRRITVALSRVSLEQALDAVAVESGSKWTAVAGDRFVVAAADAQTSNDAGRPSAQPQTFVAQGTVQVALGSPYTKWLNEDVVYIITDEERDAFLHLATDEERQKFINQFWERRNPAPGSTDNKFKDEHYRRIAYANEHFGTPSGRPGWETDRGHVYIVYGPPDVRSEHLAGENGSQFATEQWRYNHIDGVGDNLVFEFIDRGGHGDFTLAPAPTSRNVTPQAHGATSASAVPGVPPEGVTILSPTEGVNFGPYLMRALKSIQANWYKAMPESAMKGEAGKASVVLAIAPDGRLVQEPELAARTGIPVLDDAAIDAIRNSSPFNPLPKEFRGPQLKAEISFFYNEKPHS